jgi:hypothetical protein
MTMNAKTLLNQVIPESVITTLINIGQSRSKNQWVTGDLTNFIKAMVKEQGLEINDMDVYQWVAELEGVTDSTVRHEAYVAAFYAEPVRSIYEILPFSHFQFAMTFPAAWKDVLDTSIRAIESNGGKPRSVRWLEMLFTGKVSIENSPIQLDEDTILQAGHDLADNLDTDQDEVDDQRMEDDGAGVAIAPTLSKRGSVFVIENFRRVLRFMETSIETLPVSNETRAAFRSVVIAFEEAIRTAEQEIEV